MGFPVPLHLWVHNGLKGYVRDILLSKACRERGIFDPAAGNRLVFGDISRLAEKSLDLSRRRGETAP